MKNTRRAFLGTATAVTAAAWSRNICRGDDKRTLKLGVIGDWKRPPVTATWSTGEFI